MNGLHRKLEEEEIDERKLTGTKYNYCTTDNCNEIL